jgi:uncharacterized membrane protein YhhN
MTGWLAVTVMAAVVDWVAVATNRRQLERVFKPAVMLGLLGVALTVSAPAAVRPWFLAALVFSLLGDVFLMLPKERFVAGLASFLVAHVLYVVGLAQAFSAWSFVAGSMIVVIPAVLLVGVPLLRAIRRGSNPSLALPVMAYMAAISSMVVAAFGTGVVMAIAGGLLFFASDSLLGWNRFVSPIRQGRLATMVTYHNGQVLLVLSMSFMAGLG